MEKYRPEMKKYYYDPTKYKTLPRTARDQISDDGKTGHEELGGPRTSAVRELGVLLGTEEAAS